MNLHLGYAAERLPRRRCGSARRGAAQSCAALGTQLGFTLVELVTIIVILGILGAVAAPRFFSERPFADRGYVDELAAALRNAQKIAVASGCWVSVTVSPTSYQALQRPDPTDCNSVGAWTSPIMRADGTLLAGQTATGVTVVGTTQFIFNGAGTLQAAATNVQVGPYVISVVPTTGLVAVN